MSLIIKNSSQWNSSEILGINDIGIVADSSNEEYAKVGDGETAWADLPWRTIPKGRQIYLNGRIQFRIIPDDQTSEIPLAGEIGVKPPDPDNEDDVITRFFKIGDGVRTWKKLPWVTGPQGEQGLKGDKGDTGAQGIQGEKGDKGDMPDMSDYYNKDETDAQIAAQIDKEALVIADYSTTTNHYTVAFCNTIANLVGNGKKVSLVRTYTDVASITIKVTLYAYDVYGSSTKNIQFFGWGYYDNKVHLFYERLNTNNRAFLPAFSLIKIIPTGEMPTEAEIKSFAKSMLTDDTITFTDAEQNTVKNKLGITEVKYSSLDYAASVNLSENHFYYIYGEDGNAELNLIIPERDLFNTVIFWQVVDIAGTGVAPQVNITLPPDAFLRWFGEDVTNGTFNPQYDKLYKIEIISNWGMGYFAKVTRFK